MTVTKGAILRSDLKTWDGREKTANRKHHSGGTISGLKIGVEVDVLQAYGDGVNYNHTTLKNCVDSIGSDNVTLVFNPGTWIIDTTITVGSNFTIRVPNGAVFSPNSGVTLTFSGPVIRDGSTWTAGDGTVTEAGTRNFTGLLDLSGTVLQGGNPLVFEGSTSDAFETTLAITDPTADRTITVPDADVDLSSILTDPLTTRGDIIYRDPSNVTNRLAVGAANKILKSDGTDTSWGDVLVATQAEQETGTDVTAAVTPGRQHYHPSAAKGWVKFNGDGTVAIGASYNTTSVADTDVGDYTITWATDFSSIEYAVSVWCDLSDNTTMSVGSRTSPTAGVTTITTGGDSGAPNDPEDVAVIVFGDQ